MRRHVRHGSIYISVLGASMLLMLIGTTAVLCMRTQDMTISAQNDFAEAGLYARTGLEMGMFYINTNPSWRTMRGNGTWVLNQPVGEGSFSLSASDPIDNNVTGANNHPVILTATGRKGQAVYKMQVRLEVGSQSNSCLAVSMTSGDNTTITASTVTGDQSIASNRDMTAGGRSVVNANVEAKGNIRGGIYAKATRIISARRVLPAADHVLDYYVANGTPISRSSVPLWTQTQMLVNPSFETDVTGWYTYSADHPPKLARDTTQHKDGGSSLRVSNRKSTTDVAAQDLPPGSLQNGDIYFVDLPIRLTAAGTAQVTVTLQSTGDGTQSFCTPLQNVAANTWTDVQGTVVLSWTGTLTGATIWIALSNTATYYMDAVTMYDATYPVGSYVIDRRLLSPSSNPFGTQTNSQGIYVIDCGGKNIYIGNSRIVGTIVLLNAGSNTTIQGPVTWEPAVPNYPALMTNSTITVGFGTASLSESALNVNFNPPDTPYPYVGGTANSVSTDNFPSFVSGLIYSKSNLNFTNSPTIAGVVVVNNQITVFSAALNLTFRNVCLSNPPPGFGSAANTMQVVPGTWCRVVN